MAISESFYDFFDFVENLLQGYITKYQNNKKVSLNAYYCS